MAIIKACLIGNSLKNTGKECDASMVATAMLIAVPPTIEIDDADLADPIAWITPLLHADKQSRVYPFFGNKAPINTINNNAEGDILVTLDDGTIVFLRYGIYNRLYETIAGGLCYAKALQGLNKSGYDIIEIDQQGQMLLHKNANGTFKGLSTTFMYSPSPLMADFKNTPYKNRFQYSFSPVELVQNGEVFTGAGSLLALMGLIDAEIVQDGTPTTSGSTRASGTVTVTAVGADNDTIDILYNGVSISGGPVTKTSAESTVTLLAVKIAAAITAAASTNGGFTATNTAGAITVLAPANLGATVNTTLMTVTIVGTITNSGPVAFSGGVTGTAVLKVGVQTECAEADLVEQFGNDLGAHINNFAITNALGAVITISAASIVSGAVNLSIPYVAGTYTVKGGVPANWLANGVEGYDAEDNGVDIVLS